MFAQNTALLGVLGFEDLSHDIHVGRAHLRGLQKVVPQLHRGRQVISSSKKVESFIGFAEEKPPNKINPYCVPQKAVSKGAQKNHQSKVMIIFKTKGVAFPWSNIWLYLPSKEDLPFGVYSKFPKNK